MHFDSRIIRQTDRQTDRQTLELCSDSSNIVYSTKQNNIENIKEAYNGAVFCAPLWALFACAKMRAGRMS